MSEERTLDEVVCSTVAGTFNLSNMCASDVHAEDLAISLARQTRFNGHYRRDVPCADNSIYSVAQHSCHVSDALRPHGPRVQLYGLLHDAHESFLGDRIAPIKFELRRRQAWHTLQTLKRMDNQAALVIHEAFGLTFPANSQTYRLVKRADLAMLATERDHLMSPPFDHWPALPDPLPFKRFEVWDVAGSANGFLRRLDELKRQI